MTFQQAGLYYCYAEDILQVFVYRNLTKKTWSVRSGKKVIMHPINLIIRDATFFVSEKCRLRVLKNRRKEVHAGVKGHLDTITPVSDINLSCMKQITYNPYLYDSFVEVGSCKKVHFSELVFMDSNFNVWALNPK